jgi:chromosome segregation ATPase
MQPVNVEMCQRLEREAADRSLHSAEAHLADTRQRLVELQHKSEPVRQTLASLDAEIRKATKSYQKAVRAEETARRERYEAA